MALSYWEYQHLSKCRDVIIVGAGFVGLAAAIDIKRKVAAKSVTIVERQSYGAAASTRNAGFTCFGSVSEIVSDITKYGEHTVRSLVKQRKRGIANIRNRLGDDAIGYQQYGGYEVFEDAEEFDRWAAEMDSINDLLGEETFKICKTPPPLRTYHKCIANDAEGQLNTGMFYATLIEDARRAGVEILTGMTVTDIDELNGRLSLKSHEDDSFEMTGSQLLLASNALTNTYLDNTEVVPVRNQVLITGPIHNHGLKGCFHQDRGYIYFRDLGDRILIGGARHLFEEEAVNTFGSNEDNLKYLLEHLKRYVTSEGMDIRVDRHWSGILSGGSYRLPIVERLSDRVVIAVRLGGMGVAIGMDIGIQAATLTLE